MAHAEIAFAAPLGAEDVTETGRHEDQGTVAIGKAPTARVSRRISRITRSSGLLVRRERQCSLGKAY